MNTTGYKSNLEVHQQCIEKTPENVDDAIELNWAGDAAMVARKTLAAEVSRLREENATAKSQLRLYVTTNGQLAEENERLRAENDQQREALRVMSVNEGQLQLKIAQLETELMDAANILSPVACGNSPQRAAADAWMCKRLGLP